MMIRRISTAFVLLLFLHLLPACRVSTQQKIFLDEPVRMNENIAEVVRVDGTVALFDEPGAHVGSDGRSIDGVVVTGDSVSIPVDSILFVRARRTNTGASTVLTTTFLIALGSVMLLTLYSASN